MNLLSLFSGCGGMDIGFEGDFLCLKKSINTQIHPDWVESENGNWVKVKKTIFNTVFANDIRKDAKAAWVSYFSKKKSDANEVYHVDSIVDLVKRAKSGEKVFPSDIDIVTGGFPCQDFSIAGKRLGFDSQKSHLGTALSNDKPSVESRGQLYMWMRDVVTLTKPALFIAENVKGLTNLNDVKEVIEHDFSTACNGGYLVVPARVLYAPDFGVPQSRERVIFFGFKKNLLRAKALKALTAVNISAEYNPYPLPTHGSNLLPYVTCADALIDLQEPEKSIICHNKNIQRVNIWGDIVRDKPRLNSIPLDLRLDRNITAISSLEDCQPNTVVLILKN